MKQLDCQFIRILSLELFSILFISVIHDRCVYDAVSFSLPFMTIFYVALLIFILALHNLSVRYRGRATA
jgi:Na+/alanine symporter